LTTVGRNQAEGELGEAKSRESGEATQFRARKVYYSVKTRGYKIVYGNR